MEEIDRIVTEYTGYALYEHLINYAYKMSRGKIDMAAAGTSLAKAYEIANSKALPVSS
jgi:hypothetical protein